MDVTLKKHIENTRSNNPEVCFRACRALGEIGANAAEGVPALVDLLFVSREYWDKSDPTCWVHYELSEVAFTALRRIGIPATLSLLSRQINEKSLYWLSRLPGCEEQVKPILLQALENEIAVNR